MKEHTLLIGTAGTGKSYACLKRYVQALESGLSSEVLLVLPSRRAIEIFRNDVRLALNSDAVSSADFFTFGDVARITLREADKILPVLISPVHKLFVMKEIASKANLQFLRESARYPGFLRRLADFFKELGQCLYSPDDLENALVKVRPTTLENKALLKKGRETYLLYEMYRKELEKLNLVDEEMLLQTALKALISNQEIFSTRQLLIVDSFAHYTRVQLEILRELLRRTPQALVTLCYEKGDDERFLFIDRTYDDLKEVSSWIEKSLDQNHRARPRQLHHLDQSIFKDDVRTMPSEKAISFIRGGDKYDEVERIAAEILHLHFDENVPFEKIGLLFRSVGSCADIIRDVFGRYRIPLSVQEGNGHKNSPPVSLLYLLIDLATGEVSTDKLLQFLKHRLLNLDAANIDKLEEFTHAKGVRTESDWMTEWTVTDAIAADVKDRIMGVLTKFREVVARQCSAERYADSIIDFLREFEVIENIIMTRNGDVNQNTENVSSSAGMGFRTIYSACAAVLDYCRLSNRSNVSFARFSELLITAVENISTHSPERANSVQVSNVFEERSPEYRVVFLPNLVEKGFPRPLRNNPFLKDGERDVLRREGFDLPSRLDRISEERYLFYIACTRASEQVYFSYPLVDDRGKTLKRSHYVDEVEKLFDFSTERKVLENITTELKSILSSRDLYCLAARSFWTRSLDHAVNASMCTTGLEIYNSKSLRDDRLRDCLLYGDSHGYDEKGPELSKDAIKSIQNSDGTYVMSVTSLETFAVCPFRYFCERVLHLKEPEEYRFSSMEAGTAVHNAMQSLYRQVYIEGRIAIDNLQGIIAMGVNLLRAFIRQNYGRILSVPATNIFVRKTERDFRDFLEWEVRFQDCNGTRPEYFELSFQPGKPYANADPRSASTGLRIECPDGLVAVLKGRIDRVDIVEEEDGKKYGVVIDYKNGNVKSPIKFEDGTDLQVPIYMHALDEIFDIKPAGGFYYGIKSIRKRGIFNNGFKEKIATEIKDKRNVRDTFDGDGKSEEELRTVIAITVDKVKEYIRSIHRGDISFGEERIGKCNWCPYENICRK